MNEMFILIPYSRVLNTPLIDYNEGKIAKFSWYDLPSLISCKISIPKIAGFNLNGKRGKMEEIPKFAMKDINVGMTTVLDKSFLSQYVLVI